MGTIVVGVDASPGSGLALAWAVEEAARRSAGLVVVHAFSGPRAEAAALVDRALTRVAGARRRSRWRRSSTPATPPRRC